MNRPKKWVITLMLLFVCTAILYYNFRGNEFDSNGITGVSPTISTISGDWFLMETMFYEKLAKNEVKCRICFRDCIIADGQRGFCRNRENIGGILYSIVYGKASAVNVDPVEKEPLHHYLPDTDILCVATVGCNLRCKFCHNWHLSQKSIEEAGRPRDLMPAEIVEYAIKNNIQSISFTYSEPTVFYEYMYDTARIAKENGIGVVFHTNGSMNPEPLRELLRYVDAVTVDLKAFDEDFYRTVSEGDLQAVLRTLEIIKEEGVWLEIVNLVIPTLNDDIEKIREMCRWIYDNLGNEVPMHFSRFHPAYKLTDLHPTPVTTLEEAYRTAKEEGMLFVTIGNVPGHENNSTFCPVCDETLIKRFHFSVYENNISESGECLFCGYEVPGIWDLMQQ